MNYFRIPTKCECFINFLIKFRLAVSEVSKNQKLPRGFCRTPPFGIFVKENFKTNESGDPQKFMIEMKNRWNSLDDSTKKVNSSFILFVSF